MITWITPNIGTSPFGSAPIPDTAYCLDVRNLVDRSGNTVQQIRRYVTDGIKALNKGLNVIVCCDHGISRSNCIAVGLLSKWEGMPLIEAARRVLVASDNAELRPELLELVFRSFDETIDSFNYDNWLLTGGAGYLGNLLRTQIPDSISLLAPTKSELNLLDGAVPLVLYLLEHKVKKILHFAAPRVGNVNRSFGEELVILKNLLDAAATCDVSVFLPSRWEVFAGYKGKNLFADENTKMCPSGILGDSKYFVQMLVDEYIRKFELRITTFRSALVYGRGGAPNFIKSFLRKAVVNEDIVTHVYSNGAPKLDLIHCDDWAVACWQLLLSDRTGLFHCGSEDLLSTGEIASIAQGVVNSGSEIYSLELEDEIANVGLDSRRLSSVVEWSRKKDNRVGISALCSDFIQKARLEELI